jgi:hypothetical protein
MDQFQSEDKRMTNQYMHEKLVEKKVTYTLLKDDKFYIIENVPARVNEETGEQLFSPETIEQLQKIIWEKKEPQRQLLTPVYQFAA